jgi:hypothetical protein
MGGRKECCFIGAGYAGLGAAKVVKDSGMSYDHFEATDRVGGLWAHRVYKSAHLISSRDDSAYVGFPMPAGYPPFPSRAQMLAYIEDYAQRTGLTERIEFNTEVVSCQPIGRQGLDGWRVELSSGEVREYDSVVVANGHFWDKRIPSYPGEFTGQMLHSGDYQTPADLEGPRVLVVGGGSSGTDLVAEAADAFGHADISLRRGYWHSPKSVFGIPVAQFDRKWLPTKLQAGVARMFVRVVIGRYEQYGLDQPDHGFFDRDITLSARFIPALSHGRVTRRKEIARFDGKTVHFVDGTSGDYDTILWATGYNVRFPFLDRDLFTWGENGAPKVVVHMFPPGVANLVTWGIINAHTGAGQLMEDVSAFFVEALRAQKRIDVPISDLIARRLEPSSKMLIGLYDMYRDMRIARRVVRKVARGGTKSRRGSVTSLNGSPTAGARNGGARKGRSRSAAGA